jgi:hypothetical protein
MPRSITKPLALVAMVIGIAGGSYGVASAASGTPTTTSTPTAPSTSSQGPPGSSTANPWGNQRSDETLLTGETLAKVKAAAVAKVGSSATIVRIETDADGHSAYEAHMVKSDGTPVTVYVDKSFNVVSVETR